MSVTLIIEAAGREIGRDLAALASGSLAVAFLVLVGVSAGVAWWLRRSGRGRRPALWFLAMASIAAIVSLTIFRDGWGFGFDPARLTTWSDDGWARLSGDTFTNSQIMLNVALFVPAGVLWTVITRRPWWVLGGCAGASVLIECVQAVTGAGAPDVADLGANSAGGALGVLAAAVGLWIHARVSGSRPPRAGWRTPVAAAVALVLVVGAWQVGAVRRQQSIAHELELAFAGTDRGVVEAWLSAPDGLDRVYGAGPAWSNGTRHTAEAFELRYPATFFGIHRCVVVTWTSAEVEVSKAAGVECSVLTW